MSAPVLLPVSKLRAYRLHKTKFRVDAFQRKHGRLPDEQTTFAAWVEATAVFQDSVWELRCIPEGEHIASTLAVRAARRVLPVFENRYPSDARPREAVELAERRLAGEKIPRAQLQAAYEAACDAESEADEESDNEPAAFDNFEATPEQSAEFLAIVAAACAARAAAHAVFDGAFCAHAIEATKAAYGADIGGDSQEITQQRADLMELLMGQP